MYNYKIILAYDGTRYRGWQKQKNTDATIQGKLEAVLERAMGYPVEVIGSGRTDAGVHAKGQAANFYLKESFLEKELLELFLRYLPEDIAVLSVESVPERFHSRFSSLEKYYCYRIYTGRVPNVFERKYSYALFLDERSSKNPLNMEAMRKAAGYLKGTKDFTSFCGNKHLKKSAVRSMYEVHVEKTKDEIRIHYRGDGFLQNMARIMTGTIIETGQGKRKPEEILEILEAKNRELAGYTAPPHGLTLMGVKFE